MDTTVPVRDDKSYIDHFTRMCATALCFGTTVDELVAFLKEQDTPPDEIFLIVQAAKVLAQS